MANAPAAPAPAAPAEDAPKKRGKLPLIIGLVVALAGAGGGAWWFLAPHDAAAPAAEHAAAAEGEGAEGAAAGAAKGEAIYVSLAPSFVVNLTDDEAMRYLQIDVEILTHDNATSEAIKLHLPQIRNNLLLIFGDQHFHQLVTREDKEKLQASVLAEVKKVLDSQHAPSAVEAAFFTNFVMQ